MEKKNRTEICAYLFIGFASLLVIFILLNCSSICGTLFCVPLFTLAALCDGIKLILTISLALQKCKINKFHKILN